MATKKKFLIFGGCPLTDSSPLSIDHKGFTLSSTDTAILVSVSKL